MTPPTHATGSRLRLPRRAAWTASAIAAALVLAACGSDGDTSASDANPGIDSTVPGDVDAASESTIATATSYPVTLTNAFGEVTIEAAPERVVVLGYTDLAIASSLEGVNVVGAVEAIGATIGETESVDLPYVDPLDESVERFTSMSINVEAITALQPDLILGVAAFSMDQATYDLLSQVAPVVTYEEGIYQSSPEDEARRIGAALGMSDAVDALVDGAHDAVAVFAAEYPTLDGATYAYGQARSDSMAMVVDADNLTARFFEQLQMTPAPQIADLGEDGVTPGTVDLSYELSSVLDDADVLFMTFQGAAGRSTFEENPLIESLDVMADQDRYQPLGIEVATALQSPNVVAVPWLLEQLRPGLEAAALNADR